MVYALQMGGWQEKCPLVWVGWGLRWKGSEWYELQAALKLCCMNMCFLKYPNLLRGLPSISTGAVSWSLRGLKSCSAPPAQSECIHAGSPVIAIHCPMHKPQGSCFWVSVLRSCSKVPIRTTERTDLPNVFWFPSFHMRVKIHTGFILQPSLLLQYGLVLPQNLGIYKSHISFTFSIQM